MGKRKFNYVEISELWKQGASFVELANMFSTSPALIKYAIAHANEPGKMKGTPADTNQPSSNITYDDIGEVTPSSPDWEEVIRSLEKKYDDIVKAPGSTKDLKVALHQLSLMQEELAMYKTVSSTAVRQHIPEVTRNVKSGESTVVFNWTDWHVDEVVKQETVNGLNEYNPSIAKARVTNLVEKCVTLTSIERHGTKIKEGVINIMGDMITSYLHPGDDANNAMAPMQGIIYARDLIVDAIRKLQNALQLDRIRIFGKAGNHPRMTKEVRNNNITGTNLETIMHDDIARELKKSNPEIEYVYDQGYHTYYDIYNFKFRIHHGYAIKYKGGVGGISVPALRKLAQWNRGITAYYDIMGHHHTYGDYGLFMVVGSLIGYNTFALECGFSPEPPSQSMFLVHPLYGKTVTWPIYV